MANFRYQAISKDGERIEGIVEAYDELDAVTKIKENCRVVIKVEGGKQDKNSILAMDIGGNRLNKKAFAVMCSQFAIIIRSGIPIARAVRLIAAKTTDKPLKKVLSHVATDVETGRSLAASMAVRGSKLFPVTFIETIRSGEQSGNLDKSFETMYRYYEKKLKMGNKVRNALLYPTFVCVVAIAVVIVLMVKVVPTFTSIFDSYEAELPGITKALIAVSNFFRSYILVILIAVALLIIFFKIYQGTEKGRIKIAEITLKLPVFGNISELNAASEFSNSLTTLLASGLTLTKAIRITARTLSNYAIGVKMEKMTAKIEEGRTLYESLRDAKCMPDILVDMAAVGEETGELEMTMSTIAAYYDSELEAATTSAINKLEPAVLVFVAGIAGFIVLAIYVAMFNMYAVM